MLESESSLVSPENETTLINDNSSNNNTNNNHNNKDTSTTINGSSTETTPSLSSSSPKQPQQQDNGGVVVREEENGDVSVHDATTNTTTTTSTKTNGVIIKSTAEAMATDEESAVVAAVPVKEEDVDMEDAPAASSNNDDDNGKNDTLHDKHPTSTTTTTNNSNNKAHHSQQQSAPKTDEEKKVDGAATKSNGAAATGSTATTAAAAAPNPPPPVLKGTLSYNLDLRRHMIRGMWNYENSNAFPPQRFELVRTLDKTEDPTELPKDGEFHGSFSLAYFHTTSKGKQKERSKVITEHGVKITFAKIEGTHGPETEYRVDGTGTNQFGIFHINGTAKLSQHEGAPEYDIVLRKRYEPSEQPTTTSSKDGGATADASAPGKKRKNMDDPTGIVSERTDAPLPPPSKSYPTGVVCLRGKLFKDDAEDLGATDVVHRINGMWSQSLDLILADPQNVNGLCNRFEYEHKSAVPTSTFPVSGRYSGWFHLNTPEGKRTTIIEKDVNLRFIKNNAGYHNIEGRGFNVFGKYTISGTLSMDNVITIFRHFKAIKQKTSKLTAPVTAAPPPINRGTSQSSFRKQEDFPEPRLTMDEVIIPGFDGIDDDDDNGEPLPPIAKPDNTSYSAVSQGVLRLNEDGSHQCTGKWAVTREHFTGGQTSAFTFRLEPHFALEAIKDKKRKEGIKEEDTTDVTSTAAGTPVVPQDFPLDSAFYKGSFQLKKKGNRHDKVVDQQIVMKFRKSSSGAYNVYGRGVNGIGVFNLVGTLIMVGKTSGRVELYRMYPPDLLITKTVQPGPVPASAPDGKSLVFPKPAALVDVAPLPDASIPKAQLVPSASTILPGPPRPGLSRRESTRLVKLPSRLEDDDPTAQLARIMEKCVIILRHIREKDIERGAFFKEPVDPVALGIPTYTQVIQEPMDLGTVARRLDANQIGTPEEFARLVRLTFENAITFNVDPNHSVHLAARYLLVEFNKKFRDIERMLDTLRRSHKGAPDLDDKGKKKKKDDKKRKRPDEPISLKRRRLEEVQAMSAENANAMAAIVAAAPQGVPNAAVSRGEFNMMIHMIQLLQQQIVQTHTALAELSPGDETDNAAAPTGATTPSFDTFASLSGSEGALAQTPAPERKKPKKKAEPVKKASTPALEPSPPPVVEQPPFVYDDTKPLTLQEQETLTETINNMPADHIPGVIQIIRESASLNGDEDEIDLEIDQLDTVTQRKLLRHVSKYIKPKGAKRKTTKKAKATAPTPTTATASKPIPKKVEKPIPKKPPSPKKADPGSFFAAFGGKDDDDDTDSESEEEGEVPKQTVSATPSGKHFAPAASKSDGGFALGDSFTSLHEDDNDDEDLPGGSLTMNWNISKEETDKQEKDKAGGDDDDWGAARKEKDAADARNADRKKREEKQKQDAERAKEERLAEAAAKSAKLKEQREKEAEEEKRRQEEKEKQEKADAEAARAKMRKLVDSVEQTVDLDAQRDIMKQLEQSFLDKDNGGASPSSDFGF